MAQEKTAKDERLNWRLPVYVALGASIILLSLMVYSPYGDFFYVLLVAPIACLMCLVALIAYAIRRRPRQSISMLLTLVTFLGVSGILLMNKNGIRASLRWVLWSHRFKAELLAQPAPANGQLRHMEWEATGFAGVGNNTTYLVFDPRDSLLSTTPSPRKPRGIPCEVPVVRRLEKDWYSVEFYTNEIWDDCLWSSAGEH
jgi:hypothetical protein